MTLNIIKKIIHYLMIPLLTLSLFRPVFAEYRSDDREKLDLEDQYKHAAKELESWFKKSPASIVVEPESEKADIGYYVDNITFKEAYELNYPQNTGIIISGPRSWNDNPVLQRDDIIQKVDDILIRNRSHFDDYIAEKNIGDTILVEYFRNNQLYRKNIPVLKKESFKYYDTFKNIRPDKTSPGLGGAGYKPLYINIDQKILNDLYRSLGFNELSAFSNLYHGFDLQFLIGNGVFLGGYGAWTSQSQNIIYDISPAVRVYRNLKYNSGVGGVSLDKRFRISDKWLISAGVSLGGGSTRFETDQLENNLDWNLMDADTSGSYNDYFQLKKNYYLCQPRMSVSYRVLPVFWLKIEAGYMLSYSKNGWQQIVGNSKHGVTGAGDSTNLNGFTVSISPWFGF